MPRHWIVNPNTGVPSAGVFRFFICPSCICRCVQFKFRFCPLCGYKLHWSTKADYGQKVWKANQ